MEKYLNMIFKKLKKIGIKKILITTGLSVLSLIIIFVIARYIENKNFENIVKNSEYNVSQDFKTAREYIVYRGNKYKKEEKSKIKGFGLDIYLEFAVAPFENDESKEQFYMDVINIVANTQNYTNFRLIDEERKILISVECEPQERSIKRILINGEENYFSKKQEQLEIKKYNYEEKTFEVQSELLKELINKEWTSSKIDFGQRKESKDKYFIYNDFSVRIISRKVYNIVFNENYKENIINNIKVGTDSKKVIELLGKPDFELEGILGYRGKDMYVFFGNKVISIYRTEKDTNGNEDFLEIADKFRKNKESKRFASEITDIWDDYNVFEVNDKYINIEYALRGIKIQFNVTEQHGIVIYGNYKGNVEKDINLLKIKEIENYKLPLYTYIKPNEDLVFIDEINRARLFKEIII